MIDLPPLRILPATCASAAPPAAAPTGWPVLRLGFRPFYLGAAGFAAVAVPLWVAIYLGAVDLALPVPPLRGSPGGRGGAPGSGAGYTSTCAAGRQ